MKYEIYHMEEVDSTNLRVKELAAQGAPTGTVVTAGSQTAGRGRRGRTWISPPDSAIYMSLLLRPQIKPEQASMLTLVMGLSVAQVIRELTDLNTQIKWPNDILVNEKKVCGILTEMQVFPQGIEYVIIGVGINVSQREFPDEIASMATSLFLESGVDIEKESLIKAVLERFDRNYQMFLKEGSLLGLMKDYNGMLINKGRQIRVLDPAGEYCGISKGINELGELLVTREDGTTQAVYAGEVSVRGVYGYV